MVEAVQFVFFSFTVRQNEIKMVLFSQSKIYITQDYNKDP